MSLKCKIVFDLSVYHLGIFNFCFCQHFILATMMTFECHQLLPLSRMTIINSKVLIRSNVTLKYFDSFQVVKTSIFIVRGIMEIALVNANEELPRWLLMG